MLGPEQDWADLCRDFRLLKGLKQAAMAQDFNVDQSTISRWERGTREPSTAAKRIILNTLIEAGQIGPGHSLHLLLEQSGSVVALWDRDGVLRGCSRRFRTELARALGSMDPVGQHADTLLRGHPIMNRALQALGENGFFEGRVQLATFTFRPFLQASRKALGGMVTATVFPMKLGGGETGLLCVYDHDVLAPAEQQDRMFALTWIDAHDSHAEYRPLSEESPA